VSRRRREDPQDISVNERFFGKTFKPQNADESPISTYFHLLYNKLYSLYATNSNSGVCA